MLQKFKDLFYYLLDIATLKKGIKVLINDYKIILPTGYHKYFPLYYERPNFLFFKKMCKPGMNIIDIGAHVGLYSVYMQKLSGGNVYGFEPTPSTVSVLKKTIALNKAASNIEVIEAAVSDTTGKAHFKIDRQQASVSNSLVEYNRTQKLETCEVDVISIDDFVAQRKIKIDFIKIDAEGAELSVLQGAQNTLLHQRPIMILALHPQAIVARNETNEMIWLFLKKMNYSILYNGKDMDKNEFAGRQDLFDVHLVPMEQTQ
jgi:FkbM family methyltransferase